jgi:protein-S-isoprenylcysteine O-methyltransferase Ste14
MPTSITLIFISTLIFAVIHSVLASDRIKQHFYDFKISSQRYRLIYVSSAIVLTIVWLLFIYFLPDQALYQLRGTVRTAAITLQGLALFLLWLSLRPIDVAAFLGLRPFTNDIEPFIERGIYRYLRHPMYSSVILLLAANPDQSYNSATLLITVTLYFIIGARFEEQRLLANHPDYAEYRQRVPAFIPRPWTRRQQHS